jgi:hypothetical protein
MKVVAPAGGAVGSLVEGAPSVAGLDGAGIAGLVSLAAGVSVLVVVGSVVAVVFFFLEKRAFSLSKGESVGARCELAGYASDGAIRYWASYHTTHVDKVYWRWSLFDVCLRRRR